VPGRLDELATGLHRLTAPNPGLMTGPGTNTYLLGAGSGRSNLAVVDPGPDDATHRGAIVAAASTLGPIRWVLVTHTHPDHAPGAAALAEQTGAEVIGFGQAEGFAPDRCVGDGWTLRLAGGEGSDGGRLDDGAGERITLEAVHTPGHASDHLCWLLRESGTLLTGDHVMHGSTVVIRPPDGDLGQYLASLAKVRDLTPAVQTLAPGHGRLMTPVVPVIDALIAHRRGRHERVAEALSSLGEAGIDDLLPSVYDDVTEAQLPVARFSLWAHLRALAEDGRAHPMGVGQGQDTIETRWKSVSEGPA
jgi:glyoxylase-like metal-dependent hydrolase (beta-lactamase superfamily II)